MNDLIFLGIKFNRTKTNIKSKFEKKLEKPQQIDRTSTIK